MNTQEETYLISDSEHINGTNRYTFTYSPHWRRTNQKALNIARVELICLTERIAIFNAF